MSRNLSYTLVDGIKCFSPDVASSYTDYPDNGFDLTNDNVENSFWIRSRSRFFKYLVERHCVPGKTKFLEIGCGTGDFIQHLVGNENLDITASEIYLKGLAYAKKNLPSVDFVQFDVTKGTIGEQFDIIAAFDVLEHIENDKAALSNINRMLRTGGTAIISVPQYMFMWSTLDDLVMHKRRYSKREMLSKLKQNGFDISFCTSFVFTLFPLMLVSRLLDKGRNKTQSKAVTLQSHVVFPATVNRIFNWFMRIDEMLIKLGIPLPFGGTLLVVAKKK